MSNFTAHKTQHLAVGAMVTVRRWQDDDYLKLGLDLKQDKGTSVAMDVRMGAQEARRLAAYLNQVCDDLEAAVLEEMKP